MVTEIPHRSYRFGWIVGRCAAAYAAVRRKFPQRALHPSRSQTGNVWLLLLACVPLTERLKGLGQVGGKVTVLAWNTETTTARAGTTLATAKSIYDYGVELIVTRQHVV
jgi:hypothetical protein